VNRIIKTAVFKLSIASSLLLFLAMLYGQKTANFNLAAGIFIDMMAVLLFAVVLIWSLIFWIRNRLRYRSAFLPFLINLLFLITVMVLPLNWIRSKIGFTVYQNEYKNAGAISEFKTDVTFNSTSSPSA
jgi:hypothetical protein